jgi:hypothetical protein
MGGCRPMGVTSVRVWGGVWACVGGADNPTVSARDSKALNDSRAFEVATIKRWVKEVAEERVAGRRAAAEARSYSFTN